MTSREARGFSLNFGIRRYELTRTTTEIVGLADTETEALAWSERGVLPICNAEAPQYGARCGLPKGHDQWHSGGYTVATGGGQINWEDGLGYATVPDLGGVADATD